MSAGISSVGRTTCTTNRQVRRTQLFSQDTDLENVLDVEKTEPYLGQDGPGLLVGVGLGPVGHRPEDLVLGGAEGIPAIIIMTPAPVMTVQYCYHTSPGDDVSDCCSYFFS